MMKLFFKAYKALYGASTLSAWIAWRTLDEGTILDVINA